MRNFVVTIDGKSYSVGVEEVGETAESVTLAPKRLRRLKLRLNLQ